MRTLAGPNCFFNVAGAGATRSYYVAANGRDCYAFYLDIKDQVMATYVKLSGGRTQHTLKVPHCMPDAAFRSN